MLELRIVSNTTDDDDEQTQSERVTGVMSQILLFFLVMGFAAAVHHVSLRDSFKSKGVLVGLSLQFLAMPLIGFIFVSIVPNLDDVVVISLMIIVSSPGGTYSNLYNSVFNGDLSMSIAMTTVSTVASIGFLPLNLFFYLDVFRKSEASSSELIDWGILIQTVVLLLAAVACGVILNFKFPDYSSFFNGLGNVCGATLIIMTLFISNSDEPLWEKSAEIYVVSFFPCLVGLSLAVFISLKLDLPKPAAFAVSIEVCLQNSAISIAFALAAFSGQERNDALAVPVLYGVANFVVGTLFALYGFFNGWTYTPPDTPIYKALLYNFQPEPKFSSSIGSVRAVTL